MGVLDRHGILHLVPAWFQQALQDDIRRRVVREFWKFFDESEHPSIQDKSKLSRQFSVAVDYLHSVTQAYEVCLKRIKTVQQVLSLKNISEDGGGGSGRRGQTQVGGSGRDWLEDHLIILLKSFLFSSFPKNFREAVQLYYFQAFILFRRGKVNCGLALTVIRIGLLLVVGGHVKCPAKVTSLNRGVVLGHRVIYLEI